jgi:hypothetical protein
MTWHVSVTTYQILQELLQERSQYCPEQTIIETWGTTLKKPLMVQH